MILLNPYYDACQYVWDVKITCSGWQRQTVFDISIPILGILISACLNLISSKIKTSSKHNLLPVKHSLLPVNFQWAFLSYQENYINKIYIYIYIYIFMNQMDIYKRNRNLESSRIYHNNKVKIVKTVEEGLCKFN